MLFRSLAKALIKDGFGVSDVVSDDQGVQQSVDENDIQNGFIYVLSSLSADPRIQKMENLYKVGYCSGDITDRIKNAKNEPTYLMSDVKIELAVRCYNMNVPNLESAIHAFSVRLMSLLKSMTAMERNTIRENGLLHHFQLFKK